MGLKDASFNRINYALRPQKQVERRLIIKGLQSLMEAGYKISDYTYLGLGSFHYVDFILFHKYANIKRMICAERRSIPKRMRFNKPYSFIKLEMKAVSSVIPTLRRRSQHLVWLDYDSDLLESGLDDLALLLGTLTPGSIFLITVNAHSREPDDSAPGSQEDDVRRDRLYEAYKSRFERYYPDLMRKSLISKRQLPRFISDVYRGFIADQLLERGVGTIAFQQLFNYKYSDGAQMLTFGGLLEEPEKILKLSRNQPLGSPFVVSSEPLEISVPPLTVRERNWLDQNLQRVRRAPDRLAFEIPQESALNYVAFYREYPAYYEVLL